MDIVAQVFDWNITKSELQFKENCIKYQYPDAGSEEIRTLAMTQLIDRYLILEEAASCGITASDDEIERAMMEMLDEPESPESTLLMDCRNMGEQLELFLRYNIMIQKFVSKLAVTLTAVDDERLMQFYNDHEDFFCREPEVHAYQLLSKGTSPDSLEKINRIRESISTSDGFMQLHKSGQDAEKGITFGDLGYFPKGRMIPKLEKIAFSLALNEVSQPFKTKFGYHIITITDIKDKHIIPFESIREGLKDSLIEMEQELAIARLMGDIRKRCRGNIRFFEPDEAIS